MGTVPNQRKCLMLARRRPAVPGLRVVYTARRCAHFSGLCTPPSRSFSADAQVDELARSAHIAASCTQRGLAYTTPRSAHNARQSRGIKQGRRPIAPPRLICTLESPVSLRRMWTASDSMSGPAPQLLSTTQSEQRVGRRWRVRSPEATGSRSRGRRVQTLLSDHCSLDSPPRTVALRVATVSALLVLSPADDRPTPPFSRHLQAVAFFRQTAHGPRHG